ncbi:CRISPR-associated RAMP protein Csx7 [Chamaesiphon sp.]|uniref:type III CRISPR-associated RAMP protein Csx7 n=1 Tax=Chamaesiphon sp. TaxID=2814140 RepID=UPI003593B198
MFDTFKNRLELSGTLSTVTALRIGAGRSLDPTSSDLPVMKDALGRPLIPGSSFKGAMRSRLESFLRGIDLSLAIDPSELVNSYWMNRLKLQKEAATDDASLTQSLIAMTDRVSLLFGSPWMAGKLQIQDLPVVEELWFGQYQERDGVSIERDTETAADGRKYDFQVVPAGTLFSFKAIVENASDAELGLLTIGLNQFENEMIPLGGGNSRGLGVVKLDLTEMIWVNPANPQELLEYLKNLVT